jgi:hypothetical protein
MVPKPSSQTKTRHGRTEKRRGKRQSPIGRVGPQNLPRKCQRHEHPQEENHARRPQRSAQIVFSQHQGDQKVLFSYELLQSAHHQTHPPSPAAAAPVVTYPAGPCQLVVYPLMHTCEKIQATNILF